MSASLPAKEFSTELHQKMTGSISIRMSITRNDEKIRDMFRILIFLDMDLVRLLALILSYTPRLLLFRLSFRRQYRRFCS